MTKSYFLRQRALPWCRLALAALLAGSSLAAHAVSSPPAKRTARPLAANDARVNVIYTYGRLATPLALPHAVQAVVTNDGTNPLNNLPVTLLVAGSNSFTDVKTIASLAPGASTTVTFAAYPSTLALGTNNLAVYVPNDDDNSNNAATFVQRVTTGHTSYIDTTVAYNLNGATVGSAGGALAVKYTLPAATNYLTKLVATFTTAPQAASYQLQVYDATGANGTPGNVLYTSAVRTRAASTGTAAFLTATQALPNLQVGSTFFVAIKEIDNGLYLATQPEVPLRPATFYFQTVGGNWTSTTSQTRRALDVVVGPAPACPSPTNITVNSTVPTSATVTFNGPSNGTQYTVVYVPTGTTPTATSPSATGTSPVTINGLTANTRYDVYVTATCGTSGTSLQAGPVTFSSACRVYTFPYTENFDAVTSPALPCGITVQDVNNDGATWTTNTTNASSPNSMRYNGSANAANDWFYTPGLPLVAGKSYQLQFKYRGYTATTSQAMEVKVGTAATANAQTTTLFTNNSFSTTAFVTAAAGNVPGQVMLFTPPTAGTYYFGFHAISAGSQSYIYVDDLQITEVTTPVCAAPNAPVISNVTASDATVTVSGPSNGTQYTVVYVPTGTTPTATSPSVTTTGPTVTLPNLAQNTSYDVYVTVTCGSTGNSTATGPVTFVTQCASVTTYPYVEKFDAVTAPNLPCGITVLDANNDGYKWVTDNGSSNSAPNAMRYSYNPSGAADDWFFTAPLVMKAGKSYQLKFRYKSGSTSYTEGLEVKAGNTAAPASQTTTLFFNTTIQNTTYAVTTASNVALFTPATTGTYFMGFHCISGSNQLSLYVDDIEVSEVTAPNCSAPTNLAVSAPTATGVTITFTASTGNNGYTVIYGPTGFVPGGTGSQSATIAGSPATLNGLTANTTYDVYLQANCTAGGNSTLVGPVSFATACQAVSVFPYVEKFDGVTAPALPCGITILDANNDGAKWANTAVNPASSPNAMRYSYSLSNPANDWFFTQALNLQGGNTYQLKFKYRSYSATLYPEALEVKIGTAATAAGQTTTLFTNNNILTDTYVTTTAGNAAGQVMSFTPTIGGTYYIGFHAISTANQFYLYVDDVEVAVTGTVPCPSVSTITVGNITSTSAAVSFVAPANGTQYQVIYVPTGTTPTATSPSVTGTGTTISIPSGLNPSTSYDVYVRATCGTAGTSTLAGPITFATACVPATMPYSENFDKVVAPALACGVTVLDANQDGSTWANVAERPFSAPNAMRYTFNPLNPGDDWFFTDALPLVGGRSYQLQFRYRSATYAERLEVKAGNAATAAGQTTLLYSNLNLNNTTYASTTPGTGAGQVASFTPATSGNYYFGFHAISGPNAFYIYVDDVRVDQVLGTKSSVSAGFGAVASPVPFGSELNVALTTLQAGAVQLIMHDAVGRVVRESTATVPVGSTSLAVPGVSTLPAGIYLLTVRQGNNTQVIRVAHE